MLQALHSDLLRGYSYNTDNFLERLNGRARESRIIPEPVLPTEVFDTKACAMILSLGNPLLDVTERTP